MKIFNSLKLKIMLASLFIVILFPLLSESLEILRETPQLSEDHLAETNISIENNHENQSDTSTAIQEAGTSGGSPGIPVVENNDNEVHPPSDNLGFEIIELPNENIEDIPDIHLDNIGDIRLDVPFIPLDTTDTQLQMMYSLSDTQNILFQPPEPLNFYTLETSIYLPPLPLIINGPNIQLQQQVEALMEIDVQHSIEEMEMDVQHSIAEVVNEDRGTDCPICQEIIEDEIAAKPTFCHCDVLYHRNCLEEWFREKIMCPICKNHYH